MDEKLIVKLKALAEKKIIGSSERSFGNSDDCYQDGLSDGEIYAARDMLELLEIDFVEPTPLYPF